MQDPSIIEVINTSSITEGGIWARTRFRVAHSGPLFNEVIFDVAQTDASTGATASTFTNLSEDEASALIYALRKARHEIRKVNRAAEAKRTKAQLPADAMTTFYASMSDA